MKNKMKKLILSLVGIVVITSIVSITIIPFSDEPGPLSVDINSNIHIEDLFE